MDLTQVIRSRKSVRSYTGESLSSGELKAILQAAELSPVGRGRYESIHLTVVQNPELLFKIDKAAAELFGNPAIHPLYGAPTLIVVSSTADGEELNNIEYSNAAIIAEHMALAATDLGLGSCLIWGAIRALNDHPELVEALNLPKGFIPCCSVILGKTAETFEERTVNLERIATNIIA